MAIHIDTNKPGKFLVLLSLLIVVLALTARFTHIPYVTPYQFWVLACGYGVLFYAVVF